MRIVAARSRFKILVTTSPVAPHSCPFGSEPRPDRKITQEREDVGCKNAALPAQLVVEGRSGSELYLGDGFAVGLRAFRIALIKPSHYDADGYVIQWRRSYIPSNSLASV